MVVVEVVVVVLYPLTRLLGLWVRYNSKFSTSSVPFGRRDVVVVVVVAAVLMDCCCCEAGQTAVADACFDDRRSSFGPRRTSERVVVEVRN